MGVIAVCLISTAPGSFAQSDQETSREGVEDQPIEQVVDEVPGESGGEDISSSAPIALEDICNPSKSAFKDDRQRIIACYGANFLLKTLKDLNQGESKSAMHVRMRLLPYLGGTPTLNALASDYPKKKDCTVCYTDTDIQAELTQLRSNLDPTIIKDFEALNVCYATLTDRIISEMPKSDDGVNVVSHPHYDEKPGHQVAGMFKALFINHSYNDLSCRIARLPRRHGTKHSRFGDADISLKMKDPSLAAAHESLQKFGRSASQAVERFKGFKVPTNLKGVKTMMGMNVERKGTI